MQKITDPTRVNRFGRLRIGQLFEHTALQAENDRRTGRNTRARYREEQIMVKISNVTAVPLDLVGKGASHYVGMRHDEIVYTEGAMHYVSASYTSPEPPKPPSDLMPVPVRRMLL